MEDLRKQAAIVDLIPKEKEENQLAKIPEDEDIKRLEELCALVKSVGDLKGKAEPVMLNNHLCNRVKLPASSKEESKELDEEQRQEAHRLKIIKKHQETFAANLKKIEETF